MESSRTQRYPSRASGIRITARKYYDKRDRLDSEINSLENELR